VSARGARPVVPAAPTPTKGTAGPTKSVLSPKLPSALVDIARSLLPAEFELHVAEQGTPEFPAAMKDAEYFVGFARESLGAEFYRGAPKLKLIQLISGGYDGLDIGAALQVGVPVANHGVSYLFRGAGAYVTVRLPL